MLPHVFFTLVLVPKKFLPSNLIIFLLKPRNSSSSPTHHHHHHHHSPRNPLHLTFCILQHKTLHFHHPLHPSSLPLSESHPTLLSPLSLSESRPTNPLLPTLTFFFFISPFPPLLSPSGSSASMAGSGRRSNMRNLTTAIWG